MSPPYPIPFGLFHLYSSSLTSDVCYTAYSLVAILPEEHVEITGEPKAYKDTTPDSGNHSSRRFCGECGSPIQTVATSRPGTAIIKMGLFAKSGAWGKEIDAPVA